MPNAVRAVRTKLLEFALALPEAAEDLPWGERVVKVNKKVFVFLGRDMDETFGISVKLPESSKRALRLPFCSPTGYGLGKSGWVSAKLDDKSQASFDMLRDWVLESYYAVAPKGLADGVREARGHNKAAKKAKAAASSGTRKKAAAAARQGTAKAASLPLAAHKRSFKR